MRERRGRRGVGQVVRRHINGLEGGDRTFLGRGDAFLQVAHFGGERRLVTDGARRAAEQRGHFGTGLRETENVVDEQQHVLVLFVAEIFGDGERGQRDAQTRAGRFVHLAVDQADSRTGLRGSAGRWRRFFGWPFSSFFTLMTSASIISL